MKNIFLLLIALCVTALTTNPLEAQQDGQGFRMRIGPQRLAAILQLSEEQKKELRADAPGEGWKLRQAFLEERRKLNDMLRDRSVSDEQVYAQLAKVNASQASFNTHHVERMLKARRVLTPEQMNKLLDLAKNNRSRVGPGARSRYGFQQGFAGRLGLRSRPGMRRGQGFELEAGPASALSSREGS